jgi:hypothetical protein
MSLFSRGDTNLRRYDKILSKKLKFLTFRGLFEGSFSKILFLRILNTECALKKFLFQARAKILNDYGYI